MTSLPPTCRHDCRAPRLTARLKRRSYVRHQTQVRERAAACRSHAEDRRTAGPKTSWRRSLGDLDQNRCHYFRNEEPTAEFLAVPLWVLWAPELASSMVYPRSFETIVLIGFCTI